MRHKVFFDESVFLVSFSVALGILALIIPAHSAPTRLIEAGPSGEYVDLCDTGKDDADCVAAVRFTDDDESRSAAAGRNSTR